MRLSGEVSVIWTVCVTSLLVTECACGRVRVMGKALKLLEKKSRDANRCRWIGSEGEPKMRAVVVL